MKKTTYTLLLILNALFSSCGGYIYKSMTAKTPLFSNQNDFVGQVSTIKGGIETYAAYAPLKYLGLSVALAGKINNYYNSYSEIIGTFGEAEISLIPFYPVQDLRLEMPVGIGFTESVDNSNYQYPESPYRRYFIQPTIGYHYKHAELAVFMRYSLIDYTYNKSWVPDSRFEPGVMIRFGSDKIKGTFQIRYNAGTHFNEADLPPFSVIEPINFIPLHLSGGITFCFNFSKKDKGAQEKLEDDN